MSLRTKYLFYELAGLCLGVILSFTVGYIVWSVLDSSQLLQACEGPTRDILFVVKPPLLLKVCQ